MSLCTGVSISLEFIPEMEMLGQTAHESSDLLNTAKLFAIVASPTYI